jgi:hypothetical protein
MLGELKRSMHVIMPGFEKGFALHPMSSGAVEEFQAYRLSHSLFV